MYARPAQKESIALRARNYDSLNSPPPVVAATHDSSAIASESDDDFIHRNSRIGLHLRRDVSGDRVVRVAPVRPARGSHPMRLRARGRRGGRRLGLGRMRRQFGSRSRIVGALSSRRRQESVAGTPTHGRSQHQGGNRGKKRKKIHSIRRRVCVWGVVYKCSLIPKRRGSGFDRIM